MNLKNSVCSRITAAATRQIQAMMVEIFLSVVLSGRGICAILTVVAGAMTPAVCSPMNAGYPAGANAPGYSYCRSAAFIRSLAPSGSDASETSPIFSGKSRATVRMYLSCFA